MFNNKNKQEELPRAMRKMQKEKEEREKFIEEENKRKSKNQHKDNRKSKHSKKRNRQTEENDVDYKKAIRKKKIKKIIITMIVIVIIILAIILGISAYHWKQITTDMFANENSVVVDSDGNVIAELGSERKKIKVENEEMPQKLKDAYVAIEDERYYKQCVDLCQRVGLQDVFCFHEASAQILKQYHKADVLCLPSLYEGCSNVVCEAMSCGLPVVCSCVGDNGWFIKDGVNGFLFAPGSVEEMSKALERFISLSEEERKRMGERNREIALEAFSKEAFINQYLQMLS